MVGYDCDRLDAIWSRFLILSSIYRIFYRMLYNSEVCGHTTGRWCVLGC